MTPEGEPNALDRQRKMDHQGDAARAIERARKLLETTGDKDLALMLDDIELEIELRRRGGRDTLVRPLLQGSRPIYQPEGLRERLVFQLLVDLELATATEKWPMPSQPPAGDEDLGFTEMLWQRLENLAAKGSTSEIHAARFVASVWGNKELVEKVGRFDLVDAFSSWDEDYRNVVTAWCREPWLA